EMGPFVSLARWGAHVVAVDVPRPAVWERLIRTVRESPGRMTVPLGGASREGASRPAPGTDGELAAAAGVDVVADAPALLDWLAAIDGPFTLGNYIYLDGARHVLATVAVDALTAELARRRPDLSVAYLA